MALSKQLLHQLAQAEKALNKARNNHYSDKRKQAYQVSLFALLGIVSESIKQKDSFNDSEVNEFKRAIDFIFKSLEFLDNSIINLIPYEIVSCLNKALVEWMQDVDKYIIVTSLNNDFNSFSFDSSLAVNELQYQVFESKYGVKFTNRLVQFNIPKSLSRDYLISGVYYHELGHFIDTKFSITDSLTKELINRFITNQFSNTEKAELLKFIPDLKYIDTNSVNTNSISQILQAGNLPQHIKFHLGEYFCDLFAAQYIGDSLQDHLLYVTQQAGASFTHPASTNRNLMVSKFLNGSSCIVILMINNALQSILNKKKLEIKFEEVDPADIFNFLPVILKNDAQLHGVFAMGRKIWNGDWKPFKDNMQMETNPESEKIYTILNNLIEKSIGNYIIEEKWQHQKAQAKS